MGNSKLQNQLLASLVYHFSLQSIKDFSDFRRLAEFLDCYSYLTIDARKILPALSVELLQLMIDKNEDRISNTAVYYSFWNICTTIDCCMDEQAQLELLTIIRNKINYEDFTNE